MVEKFRTTLAFGGDRIRLEREHEAAGWMSVGEYVICFPNERSLEVSSVIVDINEDVGYCLLNGVIYDSITTFIGDRRWLLDHGWVEVE